MRQKCYKGHPSSTAQKLASHIISLSLKRKNSFISFNFCAMRKSVTVTPPPRAAQISYIFVPGITQNLCFTLPGSLLPGINAKDIQVLILSANFGSQTKINQPRFLFLNPPYSPIPLFPLRQLYKASYLFRKTLSPFLCDAVSRVFLQPSHSGIHPLNRF